GPGRGPGGPLALRLGRNAPEAPPDVGAPRDRRGDRGVPPGAAVEQGGVRPRLGDPAAARGPEALERGPEGARAVGEGGSLAGRPPLRRGGGPAGRARGPLGG